MLRKDFLEALRVVSPALSAHDMIPILKHFWFTGSHVVAFNDQIALQTPLTTPFKGAVAGKLLLDLLNTTLIKEIEFIVTDAALEIKSARGKAKTMIRTTLMPPAAFSGTFTMPAINERKAIKATALLPAIRACLRSVTTSTTVPDQLGITVIPGDNAIALYGYDGPTLTAASVALSGAVPFKNRVILSEPFCSRLLSFDDDAHIEINDDYALAASRDRDVILFGRLLTSDKPLDYPGVVAKHVRDGYAKRVVDIPSKIERMAEQALIVAASVSGGETNTQITVADGRVTFESASDVCQVQDSTPMPGHADVSVRYNPKHIKTGCTVYDKWLIDKESLIMTRGKIIYLISARG